ncbi:MAG: tetratricopeptide repeat protein [Gammaproteobacteria bacterium]|nr:tetratricopeptide repeat protein [Gammaproteobacteria bacterium]MDE0367713.1 tetratricopeptide repeat protein [Gammaproteobacteria bacterium]
MPEPAMSTNIGLYRSGVTSPERLRRTSVGRDRTLGNAIESLRESVGRKSKHHMLFIGPRGIGKTHLLSCVESAVESDEALRASVVVARFPEESNQTLSFADFLIGLCRILKDTLEDDPLWAQLFASVETEDDDAIVIDTIVPAIREQNRMRKRTLLVMLENLGEMFTRQIRNQRDIASLRKFFMGDNGCLLLATAPMHFDGITDMEQPFYAFFDIQILENLSFEEAVEVIRRNLEWDTRTDLLETFEDMRPKLQALYKMTGGNPRLTLMLYELIANESVARVHDQFHLLLDRISPFYQSRLTDLSPAQRAVLECLAGMRDQDKTPAAIARRMRMSQQEISSLLKRLSDAHYLRSSQNPQDRRSRLYTIREGFFDLWLAMNLSRSARKRLPFLLEFFELFYPSIDAREKKRRELREQLASEGDGDAEKALDYLSEIGSEKERAGAKFDMATDFAALGVSDQTVKYVLEAAPLAGDDVSLPIARFVTGAESASDYLSEIEEMIACWEAHRSGEFEAFAHRLISMGEKLTLGSFSETKLSFLRNTLESLGDSEERVEQRLKIATVLYELARWEESEELLRAALAEAKTFPGSKLVATAANDLGLLLKDTNRFTEAEPLFRQALAVDESTFGSQHPKVAIDLNNLALLLQDTNRFVEAETLMRRAIAIEDAAYGRLHSRLAIGLNNLACLLHDTNRIGEAEPLFEQALMVDQRVFGHEHPSVANRLNNLGRLYHETSRTEEAEPLLRRALAIDEAAFGHEHPTVANRLNNLALVLKDTGRIKEAERMFRQALRIDEVAFNAQHPKVAIRLTNLGLLLQETGRLEEAELLMRRALDIDEAAFGSHHPTLGTDLNNLAVLLQDAGRFEEAEPLLRRALRIDEAAFGGQHPKLAIRLNNLALLLKETNRVEEAEQSMRRALDILDSFRVQTGHEHTHFRRAKANYLACRQP